MSVTYTKLRDGSWGVRSTEPLSPGAAVKVTKKDGTVKTETVGKVVWTSGGVTLATVVAAAPSSDRRGCAECGRGGRLVADLEDGLMKHYGCCDIPPSGY